MDNLETLNALLDMTKEAEELASDIEKSERLRSLVVEMRSKATDERNRLRRDRKTETRYELCMIGILEELDFGKVSWQNVIGLEARLGRIREDIDQTIREIKASRLIHVAISGGGLPPCCPIPLLCGCNLRTRCCAHLASALLFGRLGIRRMCTVGC